ncbi:MAG TPA: discoidin domain-containing protein [Pyrinomonadaceae bacterium]|nr:discoidin domain-containing protein [Pyrinomonadaceae bacterium]
MRKNCLLSFVIVCLLPLLVSAQERINVAAAANGGTASASSTLDNYTPDAVIDGDRKGLNLTSGGGWRDDTPGIFPDSIEVQFVNVTSIDEVSVFTQQDTWWSPVEPTETLSFFNNGITGFEVQFWNGAMWSTIPGAIVTGNTRVWRRFNFPAINTEKVRVVITASKLAHSTVVEFEAWGIPAVNPNPTPTPTPLPSGDLEAALAARDIFFDIDNNIGFGTMNPIFNDDGTTGAFVGKWVAVDGRLTGAAAYLGLGGNIPTPGHRVGVLNFYNIAMGGPDHRTAAIYSFNGPQLGTGNLEFYTSPNFTGPVRRMQIGPTGEIGINHAAGAGTMVSIMGKSTTESTKALVVLDGQDRSMLTVRDDGQITVGRPGQGIVLKSPNGLVCRKLVIDDAGNFIVQLMGSCPP